MEDRKIIRTCGPRGCTASRGQIPVPAETASSEPAVFRKKNPSGRTGGAKKLHLLHILAPAGARSQSSEELSPMEMNSEPHPPRFRISGKTHKDTEICRYSATVMGKAPISPWRQKGTPESKTVFQYKLVSSPPIFTAGQNYEL